MMRDRDLRTCVADEHVAPAAYIARSFALRRVTLHSGERMVVAVATSGCMVAQNSALRVYREIEGAYHLVLSDNALPETVDASPDGTIMARANDTIDTIVEPVYVWNGVMYAFAPARSHVYDVSVGLARPYQTPIRFLPGAFSAMVRGTFADNFGQTYTFEIVPRGVVYEPRPARGELQPVITAESLAV
jgi:hypothetical protein